MKTLDEIFRLRKRGHKCIPRLREEIGRGHTGVPRLRAMLGLLALAPVAFGQVSVADRAAFDRAESQGVPVSIGTIATFRGITTNGILGFGLVTGLAGTGDTKRFLQTQKAVVNLLRAAGIDVDATQSESKNLALVTLTAEIPAFSTPGGRIDVTASTLGDCTSLRGGTLLNATLKYPGRDEVYATVAGPISTGGFSASSGGNTSSQGFTTVGKVPGGVLQQSVPTVTVFRDGKMYLDLQSSGATTARRIEEAIRKAYPEFRPVAIDAGSVELTLPAGTSSNTAQARINELTVFADTEAKIVIDEKTGTVVIGGNVRVAPCAFAKGSLTIRIASDPFVSQPAPLSGGKTVTGTVKSVDAKESTAEIAILRPNTTVADLAAIFQALHLKASDVASILTGLHEQGALKARLEVH